MWVLLLILLVVVPGRSAGAAAHDSQCPRWRSAFLGMPTRPLVVQTSTNHRISMSVKLAATDEARWAGFQCAAVEEIWTTVILFDFGTEVPGTFHMRNVPGPLDIAFAKESGRIFSILRMDPSTTKEYGPMEPFRYAIEARTGFFKEKGIAPGHSMLLGKSN
ncbi:MAG: DUF192 domain-containing protein [Nitrospiraceae bacterium]